MCTVELKHAIMINSFFTKLDLAHPPARQIQLLAQTQLQYTLSLFLLYCHYGHNGIVWSLV